MHLVRFIHLFGSALWIGGGLAAMLLAIRSRAEAPTVRAGVYRLMVGVQTMVIGLGALLVVVSGVLLTMDVASNGGAAQMGLGLWIMQITGLLGGLAVLFVQLPTAVKLGGLAVPDDDGNLPPAFERLQRRSAFVSASAGTLAVIAMLAWAVL
ncbi:MAG: DUF2269 family protein [Gemmatimonadales bacterium]